MTSFLVCCDYSTGGLWFYVEASDPLQWAKDHPELRVFYPDKPEWWTDKDERSARAVRVDEEPYKSLIEGSSGRN